MIVFEAVKYFFNSGAIPNGCNSSFIALIPKIPDANLVKDFRPISLIGSIFYAGKTNLAWVDAVFKVGVQINPSIEPLSHMFYADDVVFVGQWCDDNINILTHVLDCFYWASGLRINISKSKIMGILMADDKVKSATTKLGCLMLNTPFSYLGTKVGGSMSRTHAWEEVIDKERQRIEATPIKTLYPRIYALENSKQVTVCVKLADIALDASFRRKPMRDYMGCIRPIIALIPKVNDAKFVNDFRPISLIGCVYKVITKVLANRLATVISDLVSETQSAFVANRQILDGPFILNEMLNWCKRKKKQAMFFKVDFAKAYDSVRWDYLLDILHAFGFGPNWCRWIRGTFTSSMASILVNGSPTSEFPFCCGLKQGDPLAPYLFILIMESLHISFSRVVDDGLFKGFQLHGSVNISHLFYADDAMFIGEWSEQNLHNIVKVLNCFHLASGLKINIAKSQVLGVGVSQNVVVQAANRIGCAVLNTPFRYLGVTVGECMSRKSAWVGLVNKLQARLSKWKVKTLSIGGRLTLLKSVLGASPIYYMSIFKVPKGVLKTMESIRSKFFNGVDSSDRKISWVAWDNVLASKLNGGLGVSSFFALNRALLLKWVWRFISGDGSLWCKVIQAIYGSKFDLHVTDQPSIWCSILREVKSLKDSGFDFSSHCKKRIGDGSCTSFWYDIWLADAPLCVQFPRLFALELDKEIVVANKMGASSVSASFRRDVRDGAERQQWDDLSSIMNSVVLSSSKDRWTCDLSGDGEFKVKVIRNFIDDLFLPSSDVETRWVKFIPIKVNVFSWRARRDRLPTRVNLSRRGVLLDSHLCPLCNAAMEDVQHVFFRCDVARVVLRKICRWWDLDWQEICSFSDWDAWFLSFRLSSRLKSILEGAVGPVHNVSQISGPPGFPQHGLTTGEAVSAYESLPKGTSRVGDIELLFRFYMATIVTFPSCHSQAALHPEQDRVFILREYARLQGFPNNHRFCGNIKERYAYSDDESEEFDEDELLILKMNVVKAMRRKRRNYSQLHSEDVLAQQIIIQKGSPRGVYFKLEEVKACIVTCGGLCPGSNTVNKEIVCGLNNMFGVNNILGIKVGHFILDLAALFYFAMVLGKFSGHYVTYGYIEFVSSDRYAYSNDGSEEFDEDELLMFMKLTLLPIKDVGSPTEV
ncbi:RNA-directed DNA polymerase, eukaryota [Tanacetum coccineum]